MTRPGFFARVIAARRRGESERGASLVLALAMIMIISVAIVATLAYAVTSLHTITVIKEQRDITYAADGAVNTAIQALRNSSTEGANVAANSACLTGFTSYTANTKSVALSCSVVSSRGPGLPGVNAPLYALQAVGTDSSETGILETQGGSLNKKIIVGGSIASSSPAVASTYSINVINLQAPGYGVYANGACNGTITVSDPAVDLKCNTGQTYPDPNYPSQPLPSTASAANFNPKPVCQKNNAAYEFAPGYYTDVKILENPAAYVASGSPHCSAVEWFAPGVYFFDFDLDPTKSDAVWDMTGTIVGGEPKGWNPDNGTPNTGAALTGFSRWCKTEKDSATSGVQFVLGGNSQISNGSAIVELCASPNPSGTQQQILFYGQKTGGATTPASATSTPTGAPTQQNTGNPLPTWTITNPTDPEVIERDVATPVLSADTSSIKGSNGNNNPTAKLTLPGFTALTPPPGAFNVSYDLQVSHQEPTGANNDFTDLSVTIGTCKVPLTASSAGTVEHPPDVNNCLAAAVANNFSAVYTVQAKNNQTVSSKLDGVKVVMTYTPFVVRAQQGSVTAVNGASALSMTGNNTTFVMWGTVYLPLAKVVVDFKNNSVFEFRRGVISRAMQNVAVPPADTASSFCLGYGINCENGPSRVFRITARVDGNTRLVALVQIVDSPQLGASTKVWAWNVRKS